VGLASALSTHASAPGKPRTDRSSQNDPGLPNQTAKARWPVQNSTAPYKLYPHLCLMRDDTTLTVTLTILFQSQRTTSVVVLTPSMVPPVFRHHLCLRSSHRSGLAGGTSQASPTQGRTRRWAMDNSNITPSFNPIPPVHSICPIPPRWITVGCSTWRQLPHRGLD
jgi:hypothetical protein